MTYTSSFYGAETWYGIRKTSVFKDLAMVYHKCIKKVAGGNVWDSNYEVCETASIPIFKRLFAKRLVNFLFRVNRSESPCVLPSRYYLRYMSAIFKSIAHFFMHEYELYNLFERPFCATLARIDYVQRKEPTRR